MNELIDVTLNENQDPVVSARQLHKSLEVKTRFSQWVEQNFKMFKENEDFTSVVGTTLVITELFVNFKTTATKKCIYSTRHLCRY